MRGYYQGSGKSVGCISSNSRVLGYNYSRDTHKSQKEPRDSIDIHPCAMFGLKHGLALEENQHNMFGTSSSISMVADADDIASPGIRTKRRRLVSICNKAPPLQRFLGFIFHHGIQFFYK